MAQQGKTGDERMTRGKHGKAKARRDQAQLAADILAARAELAAERAALEEWQSELRAVEQDRQDLASMTAELHAALGPQYALYTRDSDQLAELLTEVAEHSSRIIELFERTSQACISSLGGDDRALRLFYEITTGQDVYLHRDRYDRNLARWIHDHGRKRGREAEGSNN